MDIIDQRQERVEEQLICEKNIHQVRSCVLLLCRWETAHFTGDSIQHFLVRGKYGNSSVQSDAQDLWVCKAIQNVATIIMFQP